MNNQMKRAAAAMALLATTAAADAQTAATSTPPARSSRDGGLEEVIVTAERREQSLLDVPISMAALGSATIEDKRIASIEDVAGQVPNFNFFRRRMGRFAMVIRGFGGSGRPDMAQNFKVAMFVDGVYVDRPANMDLAFFDLNRIEVLRGPQGTLYGKNAIAGAVNIYSNPPDSEPAIAASLDLGNYDLVQTRLMANGPLAENVSGRLVLGTNDSSGTTRNLTTGSLLGGEENRMARGTLRFTPGDWDIRVAANVEDNPDQPGRGSYIAGTTGLLPADFGPFFSPADPRRITNDRDPRSSLKIYGGSVNATHAGEALTFASITGGQKSRFFFTWDGDGTDSSATGISFNQSEYQQASTFSQEFRLSSTEGGAASLNDRLFWTAGLFYFQLEGDQRVAEWGYVTDVFEYGQDHFMDISTNNIAAYAQATYDLTEDLHLTGGIRYDHEEKTVVQTATGDTEVFGAETYTDLRRKATWNSVTPKITLDYKILPDMLLYATYSQGFLSGGFNFGPESELNANPFDPEEAVNYEIGMKAEVPGLLQVNLSAFYIDYTHLQVETLNEVTNLVETRNAGRAISKGVETSLLAQVTDRLSLDASFSYTDAYYSRYCFGVSAAQGALSGADCIAAGGEDYNGKNLEASARRNVRAGLRYEVPLGKLGSLDFGADWSRVSDVDLLWYQQPGYHKVDAGVSFTSFEERFQLTLWGRNLTDEVVVVGCNGFGATENGASCTIGQPLTYGVSIKWRH